MRRSETKQLVLNAALWEGMPVSGYDATCSNDQQIILAGIAMCVMTSEATGCAQYKFLEGKGVQLSCADLDGEIQQHLIKVESAYFHHARHTESFYQVMGDATSGPKQLDSVLSKAIAP